MNEDRIEGASTNLTGRLQERFGRLTGDQSSRVGGQLNQVKGTALNLFGQAVDALEAQVHRAPANLQPRARQAVSVARERPWLTMVGVAAVGLLLTRSGRSRH